MLAQKASALAHRSGEVCGTATWYQHVISRNAVVKESVGRYMKLC